VPHGNLGELGMAITTRAFGAYNGRRVDAFTLTSDTGVVVDIIGYGVVVRDWQVPVGSGLARSVVLGFEEFDAYPAHSPHFGSLAGRVANRISGGRFELDGRSYELERNEGGNTLHGGPNGLGRQVWDGEVDSAQNAVRFRFTSPDGAAGFPGTVEFTATYRLHRNRLKLELTGKPDRRTPISLVQHQYFNLGSGPDVLDHHVTINASARSEVDANLIPTGAILPVKGQDHDFRAGKTMRRADGSAIDCDLNLVLATGRNHAEPVATVVGPDRALTLKLWTDRPAVQLYNGVWTDVPVAGLGGRRYGRHSGLCLEDQMYPDALHQPHFPSIIVSPDQPYSHWCEFEIA
jgi:aldose 1-epimerase